MATTSSVTNLDIPVQLQLPTQAVTLTAPDGAILTVNAEIAQTDRTRDIGLMGRTALADGDGMLFLFAKEEPLSFWMKNTLIPLDIIFFGTDGHFVSATTMTPCTHEPCHTYPSAGPAQYALEVPAGWVADQGVGLGWTLRL